MIDDLDPRDMSDYELIFQYKLNQASKNMLVVPSLKARAEEFRNELWMEIALRKLLKKI